MTQPIEPTVELTAETEDPVTVLTLRIEVSLAAHADDIPPLTPMLAAAVASLLYPHGREVPDE